MEAHNIFTYRSEKGKQILFNGFLKTLEEGKRKYNFYSAREEREIFNLKSKEEKWVDLSS